MWASDVDPLVGASDNKTEDMSLIPGTHTGKGEN